MEPTKDPTPPGRETSLLKDRKDYDFTYDPRAQATLPTTDHDLAARAAVAALAARTELGNPHGPIPTPQDTQRRLAAVHASELPVGPSRTAHLSITSASRGLVADNINNNTAVDDDTDADADDGLLRQQQQQDPRESNYAPGYRRASDAVPQRTYEAEGHDAVVFPHEQLGGPSSSSSDFTPGSRSGSRKGVLTPPPELPSRTQGHDYAFPSGGDASRSPSARDRS